MCGVRGKPKSVAKAEKMVEQKKKFYRFNVVYNKLHFNELDLQSNMSSPRRKNGYMSVKNVISPRKSSDVNSNQIEMNQLMNNRKASMALDPIMEAKLTGKQTNVVPCRSGMTMLPNILSPKGSIATR